MAGVRIVRAATIAYAEIEITIRAKCQPAAIVVHLRFVDFQQHPLGADVQLVGVFHFEFRQMARAIEISRCGGPKRSTVEEIQFFILREPWVKRDSQQPTLIKTLRQLNHFFAQIRKRLFGKLPVAIQDADHANLIADDQPA